MRRIKEREEKDNPEEFFFRIFLPFRERKIEGSNQTRR